MRHLIIEEVRSFRHLVRQQEVPAPPRKESHELPPAPAPTANAQPGAGIGPAYSEELTRVEGEDEEPSSALERQLDQQKIA
jgi:mitogen-activated protein kinase 7